MRRLPGVIVAVVLISLVTGCGGGGPAIVPTLSPPPLDPRLDSHAAGELALDVAASGRQKIEPLELARQAGITPPPCVGYVFLFSWQVEEPKKGAVNFVTSRMGGTTEVGKGHDGQASVGGCDLLEAVNDGSEPAHGRLRYFLAEVRR